MKASDFGGYVPDSVGKWHYAAHKNVETWTHGPFDSKEEAIVEGRADYGGHAVFVIGQGVEVNVSGPDGDSVVENASEQVYEACGDVSEDWLRDSDIGPAVNDLTAKMGQVFAEWLTANDLWPRFCHIGQIETIEPVTT